MLEALRQLAVLADRPHLAEAPLLLWGHSMGGKATHDFVRWRPDRVLGFIIAMRQGGCSNGRAGSVDKSGCPKESDASVAVPGLYMMGEDGG